MKCKEIGELLLTYLDEEVSPEERAAIETHLSACSSCREELEALAALQRKLRQGLNAIAAGAPTPPDAWAAVQGQLARQRWSRVPLLDLAKSKISGGMKRLGQCPIWQKALAGMLMVIVATAISLAVPRTGSGIDIEAVLEQICSSSSKVHSYRYWNTETTHTKRFPPMGQILENTIQGTSEGAYVSPDRAWAKRRVESKDDDLPPAVWTMEGIHIGTNYYQRQDSETYWQVERGWPPPESHFTKDSFLLLDFYALLEVEKRPSEEVNGVLCLHYVGTVDMDSYIDKWPDDLYIDESQKQWLQHMERTVELWVGEDDYLIHKYRLSQSNPYSSSDPEELSQPAGPEPRYTATDIWEFHDYNGPIEIEPPI